MVSRRQVLASGMSKVALARAQRRGELVVLHPTVYVEHNGPLTPPRIGYDDSILDVAARARTDLDAVAALADACGTRRTTAQRLLTRLAERPRIARRAWIEAVLRDVAEGTCSVLEHGYLDRVVRPHALPRGELQAPRATAGGTVRRDVEHTDLGLAIELDGAVFHTAPDDRDRDLARDLLAAVEADLRTVRLGYRQVYADACRIAAQLATLMARHGWTGRPTRCPECGVLDEPG